MDHLRFQSSQTAASYVADQLDPQEQEAFELHMMSCPECVGEVESWRAIQEHLPGERRPLEAPAPAARPDLAPDARAAAPAATPAARGPGWRVAVSLAAVALAGITGGWIARSAHSSWADSEETAFFSLKPIERGGADGDCQVLRLEGRTRVVALRVSPTARDQQLAAVDGNGRDLTAASFAVHAQTDGSWVARLRAEALGEPGVRFEGRSADGTVEPLGCVVRAAAQE